MGKGVPRRLQRFYRKGIPPPERENAKEIAFDSDDIPYEAVPRDAAEMDDKEIARALALDEVERFKEERKRLPRKEEYEQIAESIFSQLRDTEQRKKAIERLERKKQGSARAKIGAEAANTAAGNAEAVRAERKKERALRHGRPGPGKPEEKGESVSPGQAGGNEPGIASVEKELKGLSIEDIFAGEKKQGGQKPESIEGEFSLEGLEGVAGEKDQEKCPNCGATGQETVFCPECGAAFCEKCAKSAEAAGNAKSLACPSCGRKVKK